MKLTPIPSLNSGLSPKIEFSHSDPNTKVQNQVKETYSSSKIDWKHLFEQFTQSLANAIDSKDPYNQGHSKRVSKYAVLIAEKMGLSKQAIEAIQHASILHDIGKLGVKDSVLLKPGKYTKNEHDHIKTHVLIADKILQPILNHPYWQNVRNIVLHHHEKVDGTGYYKGAKGDKIPLGGRILAVADVFDAITSHRQYRKRLPFEHVISILKNESGKHFDTNCVEAFFDLRLRQIAKVLCFDKSLKSAPEDLEKSLNQIDEQLTLRQYVNQLNSKAQSEAFMKSHKHFTYLYNLT